MDPREAIGFVTSSSVRPAVLRSVSQPATLDDLTATLSHSRKAISDALEWYESEGWVRNEGNRYVRTAIGDAVLRHLDAQKSREDEIASDASSTKPDSKEGYESREAKREDLKVIVDSELRERMLRSSSLPASSSPLSDKYETSALTAYRIRHSLANRGWYGRQGQTYHRTTAGDAAHADFERLLAVLEQIADKKPLFSRLPDDVIDFPISSLVDARLFTPADGPDAALTALKRVGNAASDGSLDRIRTICPVYRPTSISTMREFISFDTRTEIVFDQPTFRQLCAPEQWPVLGGLVAHPYTEVRVYPDDLSFGIGTYDECGIISAYNDHPGDVAGVASADEQVLKWIDSTIDDHWQHSDPVSEELTNWIGKYADTSLWGVSSTMMWGASDEDETASAMLYDLITS